MPSPHGLPALPAPGREAERDFLAIRDYGLIGDGHGAALVGRDGSIDWCCFDRFDAPPSFARLLDRRRGGFMLLRPAGEVQRVRRRYLEDSALLETTFETCTGIVVVTDLMPMTNPADGSTSPAGWIIRVVEGRTGEVTMRAAHQPIADLGAPQPELELAAEGRCVLAAGGPSLHAEIPLSLHRGAAGDDAVSAAACFTLRAGQRRAFVLAPAGTPVPDPVAAAAEFFHATQDFWRGWVSRISYTGPYREAVVRSALVLKLLIYAPTGAMVAAATTSLPETIGGCRNWDYRFCWPRDACFVLYAFQKLGLKRETEGFFNFLLQAAESTLPSVPPLFSLDGKRCNEERVLDQVEGYMHSKPVRLGNEAAEQHQLDVYGQLLDLMHLHAHGDTSLNGDLKRVGTALADHVAAHWQEPDHGIWEPRLPPRRNVHSAIMAWAALDRAQDLFGARPGWDEARRCLLEEIRSRGIHPDGGYLTQVMDGDDLDAALLLAPMINLPIDDVVLERTVDAVIEKLGEGELVWRYRNDDGLPGEEGSFLACAFWLVDALLVLGRGEEARARFEALLALGNDLGLFAEEMAADGTFLGNFPQAFTHLGLLQSALMLDLYEAGGAEALRGTHADRAKRIAARRLDDARRSSDGQVSPSTGFTARAHHWREQEQPE